MGQSRSVLVATHGGPSTILTISNLASIAAAFGERARIAVLEAVDLRLGAIGGVRVRAIGGSTYPQAAAWAVPARFGPENLTVIMARPIHVAGQRIHPVLLPADEGYGDRPLRSEACRTRYRADMELVAELLGAFGTAGPLLAWQAVRDASGSDAALYHECLMGRLERDGSISGVGPEIAAAERLGLIRLIDHMMVGCVLAELVDTQDVTLGVNISAQSAVFDFWWSDISQLLAENAGLATRLVIEITETAAPLSVAAMVEFARRMRDVGCRIALDDFGTGHASIRQLLAIRPDIAKIDALYLHQALCSPRGESLFCHLVGVANSVAGVVVAEGVETAAQSAIARVTGSTWQQGFLFGRPSTVRYWRKSQSASSTPDS
jgi:EAL domain-containing protein (putative c-di-GMP-specific phosphodiesterase class I)